MGRIHSWTAESDFDPYPKPGRCPLCWKYLFIIVMILPALRCRKPYEPPAIKASNHILAVDGFINTGVNSSSQFILTRSRSLLDSAIDLPERGAQVFIQNSSGSNYPLIDTGANGIYISAPLNLNPGETYQVSITTQEGQTYLSDAVTPKISAPIDSLNWELVNDAELGNQVVNVYVNSRDPSGNTRYYRWDYVETWQHQSTYESFWALNGNLEYGLFPSETTHNCWSTGNSNSIMLGTTVTLSADVISRIKIVTFGKNDPKMDIKYSMLVRQYPMDLQAYNYWLNVQKNSQALGGLFDPAPAEISGNIHGVTNPKDPVVGYVSAASVQEKRLFISNKDLPDWQSSQARDCPIKIIAPPDPNNALIWNYPDTSYQLYFYSSGAMEITYKNCLDCRYQGGTIVKPPFWQ
jgi:hypothetical protein